MDKFQENLTRLCKTRMLDEKWLVAPSRRIGLQWVESVARSGQPAVNLRVKTLHSMARDLVTGSLPDDEAGLLSRRGAEIFVLGLLRQTSEQLDYFRSTHIASLSKAVTQTLQALRMSGVSGADLRADQFESPAKFADVQLLLTKYELELGNRGLMDEAALLEAAATVLRGDDDAANGENREIDTATSRAPRGQQQFDFEAATQQPNRHGSFRQPSLLLVPDGVAQHEMERRLIDAWPDESRFNLDSDDANQSANVEPDTDQQLLRFISSPLDAPVPQQDGSAALVSAIGERNEIKQIFREIVRHQIPLDDVEILHTSTPVYVPLLLEIAESISLESGGSTGVSSTGGASRASGLVTFAEGFPCSMFRPGRALVMWLDWIDDGFQQSTLLQILRSGLVAPPLDSAGQSATGRVSTAAIARVLQSIPIGFDHARYLPAIDQFKRTLQDKLVRLNDDDDTDDLERQRESITRRVAACDALRNLVSGLLDCAGVDGKDAGTGAATKLLEGAITFLRRYATSASANDGKAAGQLRQAIDEAIFWIVNVELDAGFDARAWLRSLPASARVGGSGPQAGRIHVDHVFRGGHSGRSHTYIVGLNDVRFRAGSFQDPVLLDHERERLSPHLPTAAIRHHQHLHDFADLMGRLRGKVTLSFSRQSLTSDQEAFPSSVLLSAFRLLTGNSDADHTDFRDWIDKQSLLAALAPSRADEAIDETDWMAWRLCQSFGVDDGRMLVDARYPNLRAGRIAVEHRAQPSFTEFDGRVPEAADELSPAGLQQPVMSASRLQMLGRCPLAYFFKQGLGLTLPADTAVDPHRWLDPLTLGSLLHGLFEVFLRGLSADGKIPDADRDRSALLDLLNTQVSELKAVMPPPSENVFRRECQQLAEIAETFLIEEAAFCHEHRCRPEFFEASLGMPPEEGGLASKLDTDEPVELTLPSGRRIRMRGRIDRIDRFETSGSIQTYAIWDYKTGSSRNYSRHDPFKQGRVLQPYLYVSMVAHRMSAQEVQSKLNVSGAQVTHFGFFFPGVQAAGQRLQWPVAELQHGGELVDLLCDTAEAGEFPATNDSHDCGICDYQQICGDIKLVTLQSAKSLEVETTALDSMRALRTN